MVVNLWSVWGHSLPVFRVLAPAAAPVKQLMLQEPGENFAKNQTNINAGAMRWMYNSNRYAYILQ